MKILQSADVMFLPIIYEADRRRNYNLSGKVFEYMAVRKPILAAVPDGDLRDLIARARLGWSVDPEDVGGMKRLLLQLIQAKRNGTWEVDADQEYIAQFERRALTGQMARLLDSLLTGGPRS
jgi:glycosyltransferase involved in cell wall biosynthesis